MKRILILLLMAFVCAEAGWVSKEQYKRLIVKEDYLIKTVKELKLPKETTDIFLGIYLRESSIGKHTVGDREKDTYYYIHQNERVYVAEKVFLNARNLKDTRYTKVKYWGRYWVKKLYVIVGDIKPITEASLGDFNITFPAIIHVIRTCKLKEYYWYLNKRRTKVLSKFKLALVNKTLNDHKFNTYIALRYFKLNYRSAIKKGYTNPLERGTSRHNGGWNNYTYIREIDKDIKYIQDAFIENRWKIDKVKYLRNI